MTALDRIRFDYTTVETWDLEIVEVPHKAREFDRAIAELRAEAWQEGAEAAWRATGEGFNGEYACGRTHDGSISFADAADDVVNPYREQP